MPKGQIIYHCWNCLVFIYIFRIWWNDEGCVRNLYEKNRLPEFLFVNSRLEWLHIQSLHLLGEMRPAKLSKDVTNVFLFISLFLKWLVTLISEDDSFGLTHAMARVTAMPSQIPNALQSYPLSQLVTMEERKQLGAMCLDPVWYLTLSKVFMKHLPTVMKGLHYNPGGHGNQNGM